jgi:tryptophanyl-tRNA synthetase
MAHVITGIKSTGTIHLGNYLGSLSPAIQYSIDNPDDIVFIFIANSHSLTLEIESDYRSSSIHHIASALLSLTENYPNIVVYLQSDISALYELYWLIASVIPLSFLERIHTMKVARVNQINIKTSLLMYPVLMAADILGLNAKKVIVGLDQKQHIELTQEIVKKFQLIHYQFVMPEGIYLSSLIQGTDGMKMSKSYHNTIPLFSTKKELQSIIMKIKTNSQDISAPKNPDQCLLFGIYHQFASQKEIEEMRSLYQKGIGWYNIKQILIELLDKQTDQFRKKYNYYHQDKELVIKKLKMNKKIVNSIVQKRVHSLKRQLGLEIVV